MLSAQQIANIALVRKIITAIILAYEAKFYQFCTLNYRARFSLKHLLITLYAAIIKYFATQNHHFSLAFWKDCKFVIFNLRLTNVEDRPLCDGSSGLICLSKLLNLVCAINATTKNVQAAIYIASRCFDSFLHNEIWQLFS